ncbi:hypothetical protein L1I30_01845 [Gillisia sp. M10.2A]|uniref:Lipopolysaccharide assembly protein A domain-containing protein n=1 Tax=Gillisia lutea TaxID=2909668 RepID=A0ABS9EC23_9FLAO|nr:hypothetical protein [Gillisia lutea]MCF4100397.1 hypothetical protein [Gillisia lutea]
MKIFIYLLIVLSLVVIVYNVSVIDFDNLLQGDSAIALIGVLAATCVVVLLLILLTSKAIERKSKR